MNQAERVERTRRALLDSGLSQLKTVHPSEIKLRDIAEQAKRTTGALYEKWPGGKPEYLGALFEYSLWEGGLLDQAVDLIDKAKKLSSENVSSEEALSQLATDYFLLFIHEPDSILRESLMFGSGLNDDNTRRHISDFYRGMGSIAQSIFNPFLTNGILNEDAAISLAYSTSHLAIRTRIDEDFKTNRDGKVATFMVPIIHALAEAA